MRRRLRKKRHREHLTDVCASEVTFNDELRDRLLQSEPGTPFQIAGSYHPALAATVRRYQLRYQVTVAHKLGPQTAVVLYWSEEFPSVRDEAVIFSATDLGISFLPGQLKTQ